MTQAEKVLKVARSQIGYCESPKNSNSTKYGKWIGANYQPWCASFVVWCFYKAGLLNLVPKDASADGLQDGIVKRCGGKWIMTKAYNNTKKKNSLSKFRPGDVVTFDFGRNNGYRQHIGIIESVNGNYVYCIEGNTSEKGSQSNGGMVCRQRRIYSSICAVARPKYDGSTPTGGLDVDGECGALTKKAFQKWLGVAQTGTLDEATIKAFQKRMNIPVTGKWDKHTRQALQRYLNLRDDAGLEVDGDVGYLTICALQEFLNKQK